VSPERVAAALFVNGGALAALLQSQLDYVQAADEMEAAE
jgi:hypothetical protein